MSKEIRREKMLLIIEDTLRHQAAAKAQLPEAKIVNYDEAYKILRNARPGEISGILTDLHFKVERDRKIPNAPFHYSYEKNMAAIGTEMPFGLAFVLKGVELQAPVVLYSDIDHHSDLVTGLLDMFGHRGCYPRRDGGENDLILDSKFFLLRDGGCRMAEDMHWDGEKIVQEPMPPTPKYGEDAESRAAWKAHFEKRVKDWRIALKALSEPAD